MVKGIVGVVTAYRADCNKIAFKKYLFLRNFYWQK